MFTPGKVWKTPGEGLLHAIKLMEKLLMRFVKCPWWLQWLITCIPALILFMPIIGNSFVSDDYSVLKKVCIDRQLNTNGFFRPLSDITLFLNYQLSGFNPMGYYLTNILFHALDTVLLFHFCRLWKWTSNDRQQLLFAGIAAVLFLTYPFHSEPIVWILGRACLLANTFGMMALVLLVSNWKEPLKIAGVACCFFIGMTGYESVMVLPAMVFVWLMANKATIRRYFVWMSAMIVTLVSHFIIRVMVSGSLTGDYGASTLKFSLADLVARSIKVIARFILPPIQHITVMSALFLIAVIVLAALLLLLWKRIKRDRQAVVFFSSQLAFFLIASLIPFLFGVSTHTSESDRLLHFPSFFFCSLLAFGLINLLYNKRMVWWIVVGIVAYQLICLQLTLMNWRKASSAVTGILALVKEHAREGKVYIVNLPGEIDGAYVFRVGFKDALLLHKLDISSVIVVNQAKRDTLLKWPGIMELEEGKQGIFIPPSVYYQRNSAGRGNIRKKNETVSFPVTKNETIIYWNKENWVVIQKQKAE